MPVNPIISSTALIKTHILQDYAIVLSTEPEKSLDTLIQAKTLVEDICNPKHSIFIDEKLTRKNTNAILLDQRKKRIEAALLQTVFCLGQAYQRNGDPENASKFIVNTLQLQYSQNQFDHKKWALDCEAISQYFVNSLQFSQAAMCLESSTYIINNLPKDDDENEPKIKEVEENENDNGKQAEEEEMEGKYTKKEITEAKADIARCWVKLICNFMEYAAITQIQAGQLPEAKSLSISNQIDSENAIFSPTIKYTFFNIPLDFKLVPFNQTLLQTPLEATLENSLIDMFLFAKNGIDYARKYFNIENGFVSDAIELSMDEQMLWQYLACFESDYQRQCCMLKKRFRVLSGWILDPEQEKFNDNLNSDSKTNKNPETDPDMLAKRPPKKWSSHAQKLNHRHYLDESKQIWNTVSEVFADIMTLKRKQLTDYQNKSDNFQFLEGKTKKELLTIQKHFQLSINRAGMRAIRSAEEFASLFLKNSVIATTPDDFDSKKMNELTFHNDAERRAYLLTIMRKGRTYQTLIAEDNEMKRYFMKKSKEAFSEVRSFENSEVLLREEEWSLCEEFERLLPQAADMLK